MSEAEISLAAHSLLLKINIITGWVIPDIEFANILKDQFVKKMREAYPNVNAEEVEYAFRVYGGEVKDWGKNLNLNLIDEVLSPYLEQRMSISRYEEQHKPQIENKESLSDHSMREWYEEVRKKVLSGMAYELIPVMLYDWIDGKGLIKLTTRGKFGYMDAAASKIQAQGELPEMEKVKSLAKRMALNDYILKNGQADPAV